MLAKIVATVVPITTCIQQLPQVYKTYTTKSVRDISFQTLLLILFTNLLWFSHGYFIYDLTLLASTSMSLIINLTMIGLYLTYGEKPVHLFN